MQTVWGETALPASVTKNCLTCKLFVEPLVLLKKTGNHSKAVPHVRRSATL